MSLLSRTFRPLAASLALTLAALVTPVPGATPGGDAATRPSPLDGWTQLRLEGRKYLFASGRSEIARHGAVCEGARGLVSVTSQARVFGARAGQHVAISVVDERERASVRFMEQSGDKRARFGAVGGEPRRVTMATYRPRPGAPPGSNAAWAESERVEFGLPDHDGPGPLDAYALLARLDVLVGAREGTVQLLTKHGPSSLGFRTVGMETRPLKVRDLAGGPALRGEVDVAVIDLFPGGAGEGETVLNMRGTTRLWVDRSSGALLRIEGEHESAGGRLTMKLSGANRDAVPVPDFRWPGEPERSTCGDPLPPEPALDAQDAAS